MKKWIIVFCFIFVSGSFSELTCAWLDYESFDYDNLFEAVKAERVGNIERLIENGVHLEERNEGATLHCYMLYTTVFLKKWSKIY